MIVQKVSKMKGYLGTPKRNERRKRGPVALATEWSMIAVITA